MSSTTPSSSTPPETETRGRVSSSALLAQCLLGVGLLLFLPTASVSLRVNKLLLIEFALLAGAGCLLGNRWLRGAFWWGLIGLAFTYNGPAVSAVWRLLLACLAIEAIAARVRADEIPGQVLRCWRWITVVQTGFMLAQVAGWDPIFTAIGDPGRIIVSGLMDNSTFAGGYTAMTLPLFRHGRWRWWWIPSLVALVATRSAGAWLIAALLGGWIALGWCSRWRWRLAALAVAVVAVIGYSMRVESLPAKFHSERGEKFMVWAETLAVSAGVESQIPAWERVRRVAMGWGPGQFAPAYAGIMAQRRAVIATTRPAMAHLPWSDPSNEYVWAYFEFGLVGLSLWLAAIAGWLRAGVRAGRAEVGTVQLITVGWLLMAIYNSPAHAPYVAVVGIVCAGLLEGARRRSHAGVA